MAMEVNFNEVTDDRLEMVISGVAPYFVNTIRRTLLTDVPKMAIEDVEFHLGPIRDSSGKEFESVSSLFDEITSHRLGLIPIPTDLELFTFRSECKCNNEGCPSCTIMYTLNKKGPCTVYSGDLEPLSGPEFAIKDQLIPIMKLTEGQAPLIYATAIIGRGKDHAKWQAVSGAGFKPYPKVELKPRKSITNPDDVAAHCPQKVFSVKGGKLVIDKPETCNHCRTCEDMTKGAITIEGDTTKYIFHFETDGSVDALTALSYSLKVLVDKFNEFRDAVADL